jgi:hypothetical protein
MQSLLVSREPSHKQQWCVSESIIATLPSLVGWGALGAMGTRYGVIGAMFMIGVSVVFGGWVLLVPLKIQRRARRALQIEVDPVS